MELASALRADYDACISKYHPSDDHFEGGLSELDIINAHYILSDFFLEKGETVRYGILNYNMLSSAVNRQFVEFCGVKKWKDPFCKMATLAFGLTMDHAFHDGNKRTALLSVLLYMNLHKRVIKVSKYNLEQLMVRIAAHELALYPEYRAYLAKEDAEVMFIASRLRA